MLDVGEVGHAVEQRAAARVGQRGAREIDELGVDVVRGTAVPIRLSQAWVTWVPRIRLVKDKDAGSLRSIPAGPQFALRSVGDGDKRGAMPFGEFRSYTRGATLCR